MLISAKFLIAGVVMFASAAVSAQDVFRSGGVSTRSYSYFEVQYLTDVDDVDDPFFVTLLVGLNDRFSFTAEYLRVSDSTTVEGIGKLKSTVDRTTVGFAYHRPFSRFDGTDWVGILLHGDARAKVSVPGASASASDSFQEAYLGLRKTMSDRVEGEIGLRATHGDSTDFSADVRLVFRVARSFDIALGIREITDNDLTGIGLRYTW